MKYAKVFEKYNLFIAGNEQQLKSESMDTQAASVDKMSPPVSPAEDTSAKPKDVKEGDRKQSIGNMFANAGSKMFSMGQVTSAAVAAKKVESQQQPKQKQPQQQQQQPPQQQSGGGFFGFFKRGSAQNQKPPLEKRVCDSCS